MREIVLLTVLLSGDQLISADTSTGGASTIVTAVDHSGFVGVQGCQSSMCHGGAAPMRRQCTVWMSQDRHSRAFATLTTAYSARIGETLGIGSPSTSPRCTICHAPHGNASSSNPLQAGFAQSGVSCEECHNPARPWLRSHTRTDLSHGQKVVDGLNELRSAYIRAATCVACHQVVSPDILQAGHPKLTFELDGQTETEPPHWQEKESWFGPKTWVVGQAIALREISQQIERGNGTPQMSGDEQALRWLLELIPGVGPQMDKRSVAEDVWADNEAKSISQQIWTQERTKAVLSALSATSRSFLNSQVTQENQVFRAERLMMGLKRLSVSLHGNPGKEEIANLYTELENPQNFNPKEFSSGLKNLADRINDTSKN